MFRGHFASRYARLASGARLQGSVGNNGERRKRVERLRIRGRLEAFLMRCIDVCFGVKDRLKFKAKWRIQRIVVGHTIKKLRKSFVDAILVSKMSIFLEFGCSYNHRNTINWIHDIDL